MEDINIEDYELIYLYIKGESLCSKCAFYEIDEMCEDERSHPCLSKEAKGKVWKLKK